MRILWFLLVFVIVPLTGCTQSVGIENQGRLTAHRLVKIEKTTERQKDPETGVETGRVIEKSEARFLLALTNATNKKLCVCEVWWKEQYPDTENRNEVRIAEGINTRSLEKFINWEPGIVNLVEIKEAFTPKCYLPTFVKLSYCGAGDTIEEQCNDSDRTQDRLGLADVPTALPFKSLETCSRDNDEGFKYIEN